MGLGTREVEACGNLARPWPEPHRLSFQGRGYDIWYGIWLKDGKKIPVHIRRLSPQLNSKDNVLQETDITRRLLPDNIVQLYGISTSKVPMYIISECMNNGSLLYYLREGEGQCITYREKIYFAAQVACGIDYLNSHLCIHRYLCARIST